MLNLNYLICSDGKLRNCKSSVGSLKEIWIRWQNYFKSRLVEKVLVYFNIV